MCGKSAVPAGTNAAPGRDLHERHVKQPSRSNAQGLGIGLRAKGL